MGNFLSKRFRIFGRQPEDYEDVLSRLAESIDKKKGQLADIRLRERRATLLFTIYSLLLWIAYTGVWYLNLLPRYQDETAIKKALKALPVGIVPIIILFIRRLVQTFYAWRASSEEEALKALLSEQKGKIAEIKKKTNFDSTRSLLERYGETTARPEMQSSPLRQRIPPPGTQPSTPMKQMGTPLGPPRPLPPYLQPSGARLPPPQTRKWYDTLADALLGPDEQAASREKYALICAKCFNHNGLVAPSEWEDIQYKCPKCGHFNPSRRSLRSGQGVLSPTTPATPLSAIESRAVGVRPDQLTPSTPMGGSTSGHGPEEDKSAGGPELVEEKQVDKQLEDSSLMDVDTPGRG